MTDYIPNLPDKIPIEQFPRVYDMNSPVPIAEYVDASTNVRLTVKGDVLGNAMFEITWWENGGVSNAEINQAITRLMSSAGLLHEE